MSFGGFDPNLARARRARRVTPPPVQNLLAAALREREVAPEENPYRPAEPEPQATLPNRVLPEYDETQSAIRPRVADPEQFTEDRIGVLSAMPLESVSGRQRVGRFLQKFGEAQLAQPMARSGLELAGTAARSAGYGVNELSGDTAAREMRQEEIGQNQQSLLNFEQARQRREARAQAALKTEDLVAGIGLKRANAAKALREQAAKPNVQLVKGRGGWFAVDKNDLRTPPTRLPIDPDTPDTPPHQFDHMGVRYETVKDDAGKWVTRPVEGLPVDESQQNVVEDGLTVKPGAALGARATRDQREYQHGRDAQKDAEDAADREYKATLAARSEAEGAAKSFNALHDKLDAAVEDLKAARRALPTAQAKDVEKVKAEIAAGEAEVTRLQAQTRAALDSVSSRYDAHLTYGPDERFTLNPASAPPKVKAKPAPAQRSGGVAAQGAYAGHTFNQSDLPEIQKRLKAKSPEEARRIVEAQGGKFQ
jgi:hypothetical protein